MEKVRKLQLIWKIHVLFQRHFEGVSSVNFQNLMIKILRYKYYNKQITTRNDDNVQSHDQVKNKYSSTINGNSDAHTYSWQNNRKVSKRMT